MSVTTHEAPRQRKKLPFLIALAFVALAIAAVVVLRRPASTTAVESRPETLSVPDGEAGKAGDLVVTEEALQLAEIKLAPTEARMVAEKIQVSGNVQAGGDHLVKITPRTAGKVVRMLAGVGDNVRSGQSLAILESADLAQAQADYRRAAARLAAARKNLERQKQLARLGQFGRPQVEDARTKSLEASRDIQQAEKELGAERTNLAEGLKELETLHIGVRQAETELEVAKSKFNRAEVLVKQELISREEYERSRADFRNAEADVTAAQARHAQGETRISGFKSRIVSLERSLRLAQQRADVAQQGLNREERVYKGQFLTSREIVEAENAVRQAQVEVQGAVDGVRLLGGRPGGGNTFALVSPISGRVQERVATLGETIDTEHAAFTVVNLNQVWAQVAISPVQLPMVRVGDRVELTSETAPGRVFRGTILSLGTSADEATRAVSARTSLDNPGDVLKPGSFLKGTVLTDVRRQRVVVAAGALQDHTGKPTLYVAKGKPGEFEVRHVKLGIKGHDWQEIVDGVKPGEQIATSGTFYLKSEALKDSLSDGCCAPGG